MNPDPQREAALFQATAQLTGPARSIRAGGIFAGDIDTPLLDQRPQVPDAAARAKMKRAEDVADGALFCINLPAQVIIEKMLVRPNKPPA